MDNKENKPTTPTPPTPTNRAVRTGQVIVRANQAIAEQDADGEMGRYNKGEEFSIDANRAAVLGTLVTVIPAFTPKPKKAEDNQ
jgi:hypothetical protein